MRTPSLRTALVFAAATVALAGCGSTAAPAGGQLDRNQGAAELAVAQRAALAPLAVRVELLGRAAQRAVLAGDGSTAREVQGQLAAYRELAAAVDGAVDPTEVHVLVDRAGLPLTVDGGPTVDGVPAG
ncbi:hypothetical protein [Modestobacter roseus]|uniref:Uncharacterized protein n=1 Tax=Modestobacter roseus TaxID=1181884 RepID=A0A562ILF2_9ACTN|nr:hypothetical protein [Modestobacter roseus]MQA32275.1 hypothetical protein [Modestobacter roseus]TWH71770.1 hypothetical protein JD78_00268 [Modestobacter roseus]